MKYYIVVIISFLFITSCESKQDDLLIENKIDLISSIINTQYALPPPPPLPNDTISSWEITQIKIDSVKAVKLNVAIYPIFDKPIFRKNIDQLQLDKEFKDLIKSFSVVEATKEIPIQEINDKSRHSVVLADTLILKETRDWKEYDLLLNISNISFNENYDKATLVMGISRSALWGSGGLYLFSKNNEKWEKVKYIEIEIW